MFDTIRTSWIFYLGFVAQMLFASRIIVQWLATERQKEVASPGLFWSLSLVGCALFLVYGSLRLDLVIILGQTIAYFVYVRNLQIRQDWYKLSVSLKFLIVAVPVLCTLWTAVVASTVNFSETFLLHGSVFLWVGMVGQSLLNFRFLYQLYYAEQRKESILPPGFWWISLAGCLFLISYAIYRRDPVLLMGQAFALIPYSRNIALNRKRH